MCGGKSTTQQTTTIPPEVLARYNAVNARAEDVAKQPFQQYGGEFVAPLTQTQQAGIGNINQSAGLAQGAFNQAQNVQQNIYSQAAPYLQQAMQAANTGYGQASNQFGQAQGYLTNAASQGQIYGGQAYQPIAGAQAAAQPYMQQATGLTAGGLGAAAPLMGAAEGYLGAGTQAVTPQQFGQAQINQYMSPYMKNVVEAQQALQQQEAAAQRSALNSQAIGAGAFGGDRAGIAQANLARQQSLANQATLGNLLQQGYGQAAGMFQQQQGVDLAAQQANRQAQQFGAQQAANLAQQRYAQQMGAGQQLAALGQQQFGQNIGAGQALVGLGQQMYQQGLGASQAAQGLGAAQYGMGAQQAGLQQGIGSALFGMGTQQAGSLANLGAQQQAAALQGAQAQIGAGTLEQQTNQARDTALYNQFLQERGYPFQVAQFLANIAMGTGALSGSTTTTTQPNSFFSDRRLKKDIKEIGETHDGLPIYSFKYKGGDEQPRIGVMADEAREKHPDAVHRVGGIDAVDYEKIANRASEGGGVMPSRAGQGFAEGGHVSPEDLATIIAMQKQFLGPRAEAGLYGQSAQTIPGGKGVVPQMSLPVARLQRHSPPPQQQSGARQAMSELSQANQLGETLFGDKGLVAKGKQAYNYVAGGNKPQQNAGAAPATTQQTPAGGVVPQGGTSAKQQGRVKDYSKEQDGGGGDQSEWTNAPASGGVVPQQASDVITPPDEDILPPSYERGGGIRPGYKFGGGDIYKTENPMIPEDVLEVDTPTKLGETGSQSSGKSGSGSSGLGNIASAIGAAGTIAKAGTSIAEFLPIIFAPFGLKDGGVVPRQHFEKSGNAEEESPLVKYRDYMVQKGLDPHVAAGIAGNIQHESGGNPTIWGDNDNSFGLFQKNVRGELPAYEKWAQENKRNMSDPYAQIDHVIERLNGPYANVYQKMRESNDPAQAAYQFAVGYERPVPATANYEGRMRTAAQLAGGEYTGKGVVPDDGRRRSVAGAEYVREPGQKGVTMVNGEPVSEGGSSDYMPTNFRTGKPFSGLGDFLTDRQFVIPLLSGIGAMASSPSRYFGGALLQGLGAAAQSYGGQEKTQQEIAESQARESGYLAEARNKSIVPLGQTYLLYLKNGKQKLLEDWILTQEELEGGSATAELARQLYQRKSGSTQPAPDQTGAAGTTAQPALGSRGANMPLPDFVGYDEQAAKAAQSDLQSGQTSADYKKAASLEREKIKKAASASYQLQPIVTGMVQNVASTLANPTGPGAPGKGFDFFANVYNIGNTVARTFNIKDANGNVYSFGPKDEQKDLTAKYRALISAATTNGAGAGTLGALEAMAAAIPSGEMSPAAQAKLSAEFLVNLRKDQQAERFMNRYDKDSFQTPANARAEFERVNAKRYEVATGVIANFIQHAPNVYLALSKGQISPEQVEQIFKEYTKRNNLPYYQGMASLISGR